MKPKKKPLTEPYSKERIEALMKADTAGKHFHATGGQHLNADEFFQAFTAKGRRKEIEALEKRRK